MDDWLSVTCDNMSDMEADISLLMSMPSCAAKLAGLAVECGETELGFCSVDGFCFSNDCTGLKGFFVVDGLSVVVNCDGIVVYFVDDSGLAVVYFGVDLNFSVVVENCDFVDDDDDCSL